MRRSSRDEPGDRHSLREGTLSELLARALTLVDLRLIQHAAADQDETTRMTWALRQRFGIDDHQAQLVAGAVGNRSMTVSRLRVTLDILCGALFEMQGGSPALRQAPNAIRIARAIDPDAFAPLHPRAYVPDDTAFRWYRMHDAADPALAHVWRKGSVDTHIHLGGAVPPAFYWLPLVTASTNLEMVRALPNAEAGHAPWPVWERRLLEAVWLRYRIVDLVGLCGRPRPGEALLPAADDSLWTPFRGGRTLSLTEHRQAVDALIHYARRRSAARDISIWDPLAAALHCSDDGCLGGETSLLHAAAGILWRARHPPEAHTASVTALARALLGYLRVRNAFYQALVHDHGSFGLSRFGETFKRHGLLNPWTHGRWTGRRRRRLRRQQLVFERYRLKAAVQSQLGEAFDDGPDIGSAPTRALELRVSLWPGPSSVHRIHAWLRGLHEALDARREGDREPPVVPPYQVGLVVNLVRDDPAMPRAWQVLRNVLRAYPGLRPFFVGVDVAGRERVAPPRSLGHAFDRLRKFCADYRPRSGEPRIRLGFTFHAGEDSWDLLTALRHVDESTVLLLRGRGRLGHALALGVDPGQYYARRRRSAELTLGTHALDLVWALGIARLEELPAEILNRIRVRFDATVRISTSPSASALEACWIRMALAGSHSHGAGRSVARTRIASEEELLGVLGLPQRTGQQSIAVNADKGWIPLVRDLQRAVRARAARQEIAIEVNPTSNLLIGSYDDYADLPYDALAGAGLRVTLNTDDPGVFVTSLPGEFQRMKHARVARGDSPVDVTAWLQARADDARATTFLTPDTPSGLEAWERTRPGNLGALFRYRRPTDSRT